jgi:hypothetical protein
VTATGHREAVDLRFDVDDGRSILLEPCNINLNIKVADARGMVRSRLQHLKRTTNLQTMASSSMTEK